MAKSKKTTHGGRRQGAGRKISLAPEAKIVCLRLPTPMLAAIDELRGDDTRSDWIRAAIGAAVKRGTE